MKPREFAEALARGEKFLDTISGKVISIYGGPDITGDVIGYTDDGKTVNANAKNLELVNVKDSKSDSEKLSEMLEEMKMTSLEDKDSISLEKIVEAIEKGDGIYLIEHKEELIKKIGDPKIRLSQLPETLRGDIDVMSAAIVNGDVNEMQDLRYVYSQATEELKSNPKFQMILKHFEYFFKEEEKRRYYDKEKDVAKALNEYDKDVEEKKKEYTEYYYKNNIEDEKILNAIQNGDEEYLIEHKEELIKNIGNPKIRLSQLPETLRGNIDVMSAAIVNGDVYEILDLGFVYSQATKELQSNPKFHNLVKDFENFFKDQSKALERKREEADEQARKSSNARIKEEKSRYKEWLIMYDKESERYSRGEISFEELQEKLYKKISVQNIGKATINAPIEEKIKATEVEKGDRDNVKEGEEQGDDN